MWTAVDRKTIRSSGGSRISMIGVGIRGPEILVGVADLDENEEVRLQMTGLLIYWRQFS